MKNKYTKRMHVEYLNEIGIPEDDKQSNGGRVKDSTPYGNWLSRKDPIAFEVSFQETKQNKNYLKI